MIHEHLAQHINKDSEGHHHIEGDWFHRHLPDNIQLDQMAYPDTSYSFTTFFSQKPVGLKMGYASGNYGHGIFTTGQNGEISIGKFVVLQCTRLVCNLRIDIGDHCMFSWGSTITDSWAGHDEMSIASRKKLLEAAAINANRHIEFDKPQPVVI